MTNTPMSTASRVEARLNELKAEITKLRGFAEAAVVEIAKLRGFVETVASQSAAPGSWMARLKVDARELLAEIDDKED